MFKKLFNLSVKQAIYLFPCPQPLTGIIEYYHVFSAARKLKSVAQIVITGRID